MRTCNECIHLFIHSRTYISARGSMRDTKRTAAVTATCIHAFTNANDSAKVLSGLCENMNIHTSIYLIFAPPILRPADIKKRKHKERLRKVLISHCKNCFLIYLYSPHIPPYSYTRVTLFFMLSLVVINE